MANDLSGKTAIVTGSAKGIGRGIALELGRQGANVVVNYRNDEEAANGVLRELRDGGAQAIAVQADIGSEADVERLIAETVAAFGGVDVLVNNAAIGGGRGSVLDLAPADWQETMRINVLGMFLCTQQAARNMQERGGGAVVNIGSMAPAKGFPGLIDYNTSKGAVHQFTRSAANDLGPHNIRVNCVAPGTVPDGFNRDRHTPESLAMSQAKTALDRLGEPENIGNAVAFLASDRSSWTTGQVLFIEGGILVKA